MAKFPLEVLKGTAPNLQGGMETRRVSLGRGRKRRADADPLVLRDFRKIFLTDFLILPNKLLPFPSLFSPFDTNTPGESSVIVITSHSTRSSVLNLILETDEEISKK
ncbi:hypothetical protein M758_2G067600 [Ceratodon purpureus]|nr:hypothetical protein M758_2G067600 [Ceratodon purpureus]